MWKPTQSAASSLTTGGTGTGARSNLQTGGVKAFGLQLPKSKQTTAATSLPLTKPKPKAFAMDDDDDEEEAAPTSRYQSLQMETIRQKRMAADAARVLSEDPNAFSYDEVYDAEQAKRPPVMQSAVARLGLASSTSNITSAPTPAPTAPSRYISALLSKSVSRKLEQESVYERGLLKERLKEDQEHAGKEKFLTAAYKEKLAEQARLRAEQEEQDKRDEALEEAKRKGGFIGSSLALAASRNILDRMAGGAAAAQEEKKEERMIDIPQYTSNTSSTSTAAGSTAPATTASTKRDRQDSTSLPSTAHHDDDERLNKRQKVTIDSDVSTAAAPSSIHPPTDSTSTQLPPPPVPSIHQVDAIAVVAAKLTTARDSMSKAEEARARLAARKAAAAAVK